jgi:hypothetical protein
MDKKMRYEITLDNHGLSDYDKEKVRYVFTSESPTDALEKVAKIKRSVKDISYYANEFLEAVAISAEADLYVR